MNQIDFLNTIKPFKDKMFRLAKRLLVSHEEAQDSTQEVILKLWNKNQELEQYKSVEAFAMILTKNYCLDQLKSKRASNLQIVHNDFLDNKPGLQQEVENKDSLSWIKKYINELPEQQKMVIQLRDIEQYEFDEIAKILEITEATIRVNLSRARKTIREKMIKTQDYGIN